MLTMLTLQRVRRRSFWRGPAWGASGLIAGSGGGLFMAAVILTLAGRSILGWEPAAVGLALTGGGPLAVVPWLVVTSAAGRGWPRTRPLAWLAPAWLLGAVGAGVGTVLWTASR